MRLVVVSATVLLALAAAAPADASVPGRYVVKGKPLVKGAGRSVSVFARPTAVVVEGCRSSSPRVRSRRGRVSVAARVLCESSRRKQPLAATISGKRMRGTLGKRRFTATLRAPAGTLLKGRGRALGAVRNTDKLGPHPDREVSLARGGAEIARTELDLLIKPSATVAQVNAALRSVGGRIAGAVDDSRRLIVAIPDPGSLAALDAVIASVAKRPGIERVSRAEMAVDFSLPPGLGSPLATNKLAGISHLIALRAPAAWNARGAIQLAKRPTLIVTDKFGDGPLDRGYLDADCLACTLASGRPHPESHGYHVVGIAAGSFANDGTPRGLVTGVFPATARLKVVDMQAFTVGAGVTETMLALDATPGHVVLNTSWGHSENAARDARVEGSAWQAGVRSAGLESRVLHAASAGNNAAAADLFSEWNAATLRTDLINADSTRADPLSNTLVAENLLDSGAPSFDSGCLAFGSNHNGNIAAVGTDVFSHIKRREGSRALVPAGAGDLTGTSMAAPQVASLAEYVWSIAPDLTPAQIVSMLIATARPALDCPAPDPSLPKRPSARRLDAYAAVLSLDRGTTGPEAPVRLAILNRNDDTAFDATDLSAHAAAIAAGNPSGRDWGRSDLNGDGFTGLGTTATPFDLDPSASTRAKAPSLGSVNQTIEGSAVSFNENQVSDLDVLCYYAYSALYTPDSGQRASLLTSDLKGCGLPLTVAPSSTTLEPGATAQFSAKVGNATDGTVAWAASGGSISPSGLYTAPSTPGTYVVAATDVTDPTRSATATVTVVDPAVGGKYLGDSTHCETDPVDECFPPEHTKALLQVSGTDFTLYWRSEGMGFGTSFPTPDCINVPSCQQFTGTRSGSSYSGVQTGPGVNPDNAQTIQFTISGETLSGRIDDPPTGNGDFITFSLTHDPT